MKKISLSLLLLTLGTGLFAQTTGNDLYEWGKAFNRQQLGKGNSEDNVRTMQFITFISGVTEVFLLEKVLPFVTDVTNSQVYDAVMNYLTAHPEYRSASAVDNVLVAVATAWGPGENYDQYWKLRGVSD